MSINYSNFQYDVTNTWGKTGTQHPGGTFTMGCNKSAALIKLDVSSTDNGQTLTGTAQYQGNGSIGIKFTYNNDSSAPNAYDCTVTYGGVSYPRWTWVLGDRGADQLPVAFNISNGGEGTTLTGTMTYNGEGHIGFSGSLNS